MLLLRCAAWLLLLLLLLFLCLEPPARTCRC
jgi:hypothetical protein